MQKKLLAVAVAGALAAPGVALAQSSVTISGIFKASLEQVNLGSRNPSNALAAQNLHSTATRLADDSSRIIFGVTEDLGGGLSAVAQLDMRFRFDESGAGTATNVGGVIASGNSFVGLRSQTWGQVLFGRRDLHYGNTESLITTKAVSLRQDSISLLAYIDGTAIANGTRTQNVLMYTTPNWSGFTVVGAYSTNSPGNDNDLQSAVRSGNAWNLNPNFRASNWNVGYSYWQQRSDGATVTTAAVPPGFTITSGAITATAAVPAAQVSAGVNQRGDRLYGSYIWGGLQVGLAWDKSTLKAVGAISALPVVAGSTTIDFAKRTVWSIPVSYTTGNHNFYGHYTWADDDDTAWNPLTPGLNRSSIVVGGVCGTAALGRCGTGASMWALAYVYDLSKRTSLGVSYSQIKNENGAAYNHFTSTSLGGPDSAVVAGEDPKIFAATIRHAF